MKTYNEMTHEGRRLLWRAYGHRGGKTYEVCEPFEAGKGQKTIRRNIGFWVVDEFSLLKELANNLD